MTLKPTRSLTSCLTALSIAAALAAVPRLALADSHPHITPLDCSSATSRLGAGKVWHAGFFASRLDDFGQREWIRVTPCFASHSDCFNWLYWAQTDWPDQDFVGRCREGAPY